jgi:hypothetical protein
LQNEFGKQAFQFEFLDDKRLTFNFQLDAGEQSKPYFECQVGIADKSVPCKVVEKSLIFHCIILWDCRCLFLQL